MTDNAAGLATPTANPRWWDRPKLLRGLLIASMALNVLVVSTVATRLVRGERFERMPGASQVQLIPRNFLRQLPGDKAKAARDILKRMSADQRGDRQWMREVSLKLADAISAEPYDVEKIKAVFTEFASRNDAAVNRSSVATLEVIALLTPEERAGLAEAIRARASSRR